MPDNTIRIVPFSQDVFRKHKRQIESFFGTHSDTNQVPITFKTCRKLIAMHPNTLLYAIDNQGVVFGSICVVPTTKALARQFVKGTITEKELFDQTPVQSYYDALYLCSIFVAPAYQGKGFAQVMIKRAIELLQPDFASAMLFSWTITGKGKRLVEGLEKDYGWKVNLRQPPILHKEN